MRQQAVSVCVAAFLAAGGLAASGCATHEDVHEAIGEHNTQNQQQFAHRQGQHNSQQGQIDELKGESDAALARAEATHKLAEGDFKHEVVFTDDTVKFETGKSELSPDAQAALNTFAEKVKSMAKTRTSSLRSRAMRTREARRRLIPNSRPNGPKRRGNSCATRASHSIGWKRSPMARLGRPATAIRKTAASSWWCWSDRYERE